LKCLKIYLTDPKSLPGAGAMSSGLFGAAQPSAGGGLFGSQPQQQPGGLFGQESILRITFSPENFLDTNWPKILNIILFKINLGHKKPYL
jgi:hypothetical protein